MSWPAGTIVVCVDASSHNIPGVDYEPHVVVGDPLSEGSYYTIRRAGPYDFGMPHGTRSAVFLSENTKICGSMDVPWCATRFRRAESTHSEAGSVRQSTEAQ